MSQSTIWKIENARPPRRITFDEAVAFAHVFNVKLDDLRMPFAVAASKQATDIMRKIQKLEAAEERIGGAIETAWAELVRVLGTEAAAETYPEWLDRIEHATGVRLEEINGEHAEAP